MASAFVRSLCTGLAASSLLAALPASAHISLERGGTHKSRYGDAELKDGPCGRANGTRGTNVYTYEPGQTITVKFNEYVPHPGYFRIAFDNDGDNDFQDPASIKPIDPARKCPFNAADKCGASDFYNNATVLPGMDNLAPHLAGEWNKQYSFDVKLPDVECTNCTLQIIQVMEDTIHGAYNPTPGDPNDSPYVADNYHQCIDLVLKRAAGTGGTAGAGGTAGSGGSGGSPDGGCACSVGESTRAQNFGALAFAAGIALALWKRRRA